MMATLPAGPARRYNLTRRHDKAKKKDVAFP
jgi:hypothetical protein